MEPTAQETLSEGSRLGALRRVLPVGDAHERWLVLIPLGFLGLLFLYPLGDMVASTFSGERPWSTYAEALGNEFFLHSVIRTLIMSFTSTVVCLVLGYAIAYEVTRRPTKLRMTILGIVIVTFWISLLIRAYATLTILQPNGVFADFIGLFGIPGERLDLQGTTVAVTIGMVYYLLPYMVMVLIPPLRAADPALLRAAHSLGATRARTFWRVTVPLTAGGIVAGSILGFIFSIGSYVMPALLGGPAHPFVANIIGGEVGRFQAFPLAGAMSVLLTVVVLCLYTMLVRVADPTKIMAGGEQQ